MKAITRKEKIMSGENLTPITRREMFLAKAAGQNVETPTPITREEMFLSMISCGKTDQQQYAAGLYQTGAIALYEEQGADAIEGMMIKSWDELLADGTVIVENGVVYTILDMSIGANSSSDALAGDLLLPYDDSITKLGNIYWDDSIWNDSVGDYGNYVGNMAFSRCANLTGIVIPDSVTSISFGAFVGCVSLSEVTLSNNLESIGEHAFDNCVSLSEVTLPNNLKSIGEYAFVNCESLESVIIPEGVINIDSDAFENCTNLTSVTIPNSVTNIGGYAFFECSELENVTFGENSELISIGEATFGYCKRLESIRIPNSVTIIGEWAFQDCENLTDIMFEGAVSQWNDIEFGDGWNYNVPATKVICSDGEVSLV